MPNETPLEIAREKLNGLNTDLADKHFKWQSYGFPLFGVAIVFITFFIVPQKYKAANFIGVLFILFGLYLLIYRYRLRLEVIREIRRFEEVKTKSESARDIQALNTRIDGFTTKYNEMLTSLADRRLDELRNAIVALSESLKTIK